MKEKALPDSDSAWAKACPECVRLVKSARTMGFKATTVLECPACRWLRRLAAARINAEEEGRGTV